MLIYHAENDRSVINFIKISKAIHVKNADKYDFNPHPTTASEEKALIFVVLYRRCVKC